ncbi:ribosomal protein L16 (apicoplast) [Theileria orientalis]|uniref:Ribosomal protein L16 n=1 Tax=Theileria orientalis TaxID=68886 RepID=A0A976XJ25_THEOR|nr:ribosomal protein L16 [Theileria orientalis]
MSNLLFPKTIKYNNNHMYKLKNIKKPYKLDYGDWGIVANESNIITPNQIESARCCISKNIKNYGKMWTKILPNHIISKKPKDSRMGAGKGKIFKWLFILKPGDVIFESTLVPLSVIIKTFKLVKKKLKVKTKLIITKNV